MDVNPAQSELDTEVNPQMTLARARIETESETETETVIVARIDDRLI